MPVSLHEAVGLHERIEAAAYRDLIEAAPAELREKLGLSYHTVADGIVFVCRALDHIMFDRAVGLGLSRDVPAEALDKAVSIFEANGIKNWVVQLAPVASALEEYCSLRGLIRHPRTWAIFSRGTEAAETVATDLTIRELGASDRDAFAEVVAKSFGLPLPVGTWAAGAIGRPRWRYFGGFAEHEMIACGAIYVDGRASWFGFGATLAEYRGRRAQQALLAARIDASRHDGAEILFTETGIPHPGEAGPSFKNIQRAGFRIAYERPNLKRP